MIVKVEILNITSRSVGWNISVISEPAELTNHQICKLKKALNTEIFNFLHPYPWWNIFKKPVDICDLIGQTLEIEV
ncbi:MAG: hypothetical protein PHH85_09035 [Candidatus Methanoperedens sp.]|nr:hypothetical protein [Candidatus Methanoperedens sp.]